MGTKAKRNASLQAIKQRQRLPSFRKSFDSYILERIYLHWPAILTSIRNSNCSEPNYSVVDYHLLQNQR